MTPETKAKLTRGLKTTEFWVVMAMGVLTSIMVTLQDHAENVLPIELQMKILGGLATAYVICRTALKVVGLVATVLKLDRGEPMPVPTPPAGVKLPEMPVPSVPGLGLQSAPVAPTFQESPHWKGYVSQNAIRERDLAEAEERERQAGLKALLTHAGQQPASPARPPVVISSPAPLPPQPQSGREY